MANEEQMRICLLLAFQAMVTHGDKITKDTTPRVIALAKSMNDFCEAKLAAVLRNSGLSFAETGSAQRADIAISFLQDELKRRESMTLPKDRETLVWIYDRLQQRKIQRTQWQFYATAPEGKLAELVLSLLNEENEDAQIRGQS